MTYRQRKSRRRRRPKARGKILLGVGVLATVLMIAVASAAGYVLAIASSAPELSELKADDKGEVSVVFAADGSRLGFVQSDVLRRVVPFKDMPQEMRQATVAIEDERFYKHEGVDFNAIIRAGIKNLESGKTVQGGSTITQQLVRALYIRDPKRDFARKIREAKLASELEEKRSKRWILHEYLNSVPYGTVGGRTAIGAQAAAVTFFSKDVDELNLAESALLAGLPQAPSEYNPFRNPQAALSRRNEVLRAMFDNGYISQAELLEATDAPLRLKRGTRYTQRREPYFFDYVQEELIERYGVGVVRRGGLKIHTTVQPGLQDAAREAINAYYGDPAGPSSAIVAVDPSTGKIRAMASSGTYGERRFNLAAQGHRQPGSAFKTFVLTAAILDGVDPDSTSYTSKPLNINDPAFGHWEVKTFGNSYSGTVSLTRATLASDNTVYAQLILDLGPEKVCKAAKLLGITTKLDCYPAEGLGGLTARRHDARDGERVRDARERRHPPQGHGHRKGRLPRRQERAAREPEGQARDDRRPGLRGHEDPRDERDLRHRHRRGLRLPGGRQDGDDRRGEGRLVRGLYAAPVDGGLGRLSGCGHRDAGRPGRNLRRARLARLHACPPATATATTSRSRPRRSCPRPSSASTRAPGAAPTTATATTTRRTRTPSRPTAPTAEPSTTRTSTSPPRSRSPTCRCRPHRKSSRRRRAAAPALPTGRGRGAGRARADRSDRGRARGPQRPARALDG